MNWKIWGVAGTALALSACQMLPTLSTLSAPPKQAEVTSMITPMVQKRETVTATGYAAISVQPHKLPAQQRLMAIRAAKLDAYRALTEQVYGQYVDANTTIADMVIMNDTLRGKVEGVVYGARLLSINPVGDDTYEVTLSLDAQVVDDLRLLYLGQLASGQIKG